MNAESFNFRGDNGGDVFCWYWGVPDKPVGIVQIFHGMAEHAGRYADLARYLNTFGFAVYACDQRGHGRTGEMNGSPCHLDKEGFYGIMHDQEILSEQIRDKHHGVPLFILAHSFGSFVAQEYIKYNGEEIRGIILSGTCKMEGAAILAGYVISILSMAFGKRRANVLLDLLSFGSYNKAIKNAADKFSWLSRDENQVAIYNSDRFCGNIMSTGFFHYFFKGLMNLNRNTEWIPKNLPVCLISGGEDPVGQYGKGVSKLYETYKGLGIEDLEIKLYPKCRHEIINELNRQEVYQDIAAWLQKHAAQ